MIVKIALGIVLAAIIIAVGIPVLLLAAFGIAWVVKEYGVLFLTMLSALAILTFAVRAARYGARLYRRKPLDGIISESPESWARHFWDR